MSTSTPSDDDDDPSRTNPPYAALALSLVVQEWSAMGVSESTSPTPDLGAMVNRVTALLLVRIVAVATAPKDVSTAGMCRNALLQGWKEWPHPVTAAVVSQVAQYVRSILAMYHPDNPYHNAEHATHVVMSTAHLIDQMLHSTGKATRSATFNSKKNRVPSSLFGLRHDPISLLSLVFAALIHDVQHPGVPNRQLSAEDDDLAVLYNDQSVAEQHSLRLGFTELLKPEYEDLQRLLGMGPRPGPGTPAPSGGGDATATATSPYRRFRRHVINLVLNTDIASPERTQLFKSKFREAFPPPVTSSANNAMQSSMGSILASDYHIKLDEDDDEELAGKDANGDNGSMLQHFLRREGTLNFSDPPGGAKPRSASLPTPSTVTPASPAGRKFRQRLGIRRSMDLSGEAIEAFSTHSRGGGGGSNSSEGGDPSGGGLGSDDDDFNEDDDDDTDELKASVVLECVLTACDVAHNLQGFSQMCTWSQRLYGELLRAHRQHRGPDPAHKWFENQIGFLESYLMPLAARLDETGVFDLKFARIVGSNLDQWLVDGLEFTEAMIANGNTIPS